MKSWISKATKFTTYKSNHKTKFRSAGDEARSRRSWTEAAANYHAHLLQQPDDFDIWVQLGHAHKEAGNFTQARSAYAEAVRLNPADDDVHLNIGHLEKLAGARDTAVSAYMRAYSANKYSMDALHELISLNADLSEFCGETTARDISTVYLDITDLMEYVKSNSALSGIQRVAANLINGIDRQQWDNREYNIVPVIPEFDTLRIFSVNSALVRLMIDSLNTSRGNIEKTIGAIYASRKLVEPQCGDVFAINGAFWISPFFNMIHMLRNRGVKFILFIHDLIPISHPQLVHFSAHLTFRRSLVDALLLANAVLTNSEFVAHDVRSFMRRHLRFALPVKAISLATEIPAVKNGRIAKDIAETLNHPYVLFVSTIEIRKNHIYVIKLWEKLIENDAPNIPNLVFVGKFGWKVEALQNRIKQSDHLGGRLRLFNDVSDSELVELYKHCLFTIFPSFVEGFGLPVGESLAYGKPCISSNSSSMPEVGGPFAQYVNPEDVDAGYLLVRDLLENTSKLAQWTHDIVRGYKPKTWKEFALEYFSAVIEISKTGEDSANCSFGSTGVISQDYTQPDEPAKPSTYGSAARATGWFSIDEWDFWTSTRRAALRPKITLTVDAPVMPDTTPLTIGSNTTKREREGLRAEQIQNIYRSYFGRDADIVELDSYVGRSEEYVVDCFEHSPEFIERFPAVANLTTAARRNYIALCRQDVRAFADNFHPRVMKALEQPLETFLRPSLDDVEVVLGMATLGRPSVTLALRSLLNQMHIDRTPFKFKILLTVPESWVPDAALADLIEEANGCIAFVKMQDYGPISKLLGVLESTSNSEALVLLADDDVIYPPLHFSLLVAHFQALNGDFAVGCSGFNWNSEVRREGESDFVSKSYSNREGHLQQMHFIETWCGVCLGRAWFLNDFVSFCKQEALLHPDLMRTDDSVYSTYLTLVGVNKLNINTTHCNRIDSGHSPSFATIAKMNNGYDSLNGSNTVSLQWTRLAAHLFRIQFDIFRYCVPPRPTKKIAMITVCVGDSYRVRMHKATMSKVAYCHKHGYEFVDIGTSLDDNIPLIWTKLLAIQRLLRTDVDLIMYTDADVVITNPTITLESIADASDGEILYTNDINGPNIGNILVKNTKRARDVIDTICKMDGFHYKSPWYEQAAFTVYLRENPELTTFIKDNPQREFNSYLYNWHHNDFLVHFAGVYGPILDTAIDAVYRIAYERAAVSRALCAPLRAYFQDYTADPRAEIHLLPTPKANSRDDLYCRVNNTDKDRLMFLVLFSDGSQEARRLADGISRCQDVLCWDSEVHAITDWPRLGRWIGELNPVKRKLFLNAGSSGATSANDIRRALSPVGDVRFIFVEGSRESMGQNSFAAIAAQAEHRERSIHISTESLIEDPSLIYSFLIRFTGLLELPRLLTHDYSPKGKFEHSIFNELFHHRCDIAVSPRPFNGGKNLAQWEAFAAGSESRKDTEPTA